MEKQEKNNVFGCWEKWVCMSKFKENKLSNMPRIILLSKFQGKVFFLKQKKNILAVKDIGLICLLTAR